MEINRDIEIEHRMTLAEARIEEHDREISDIRGVLNTAVDAISKQATSNSLLWQIVKAGLWVISTVSVTVIGYLLYIILPKIFGQ